MYPHVGVPPIWVGIPPYGGFSFSFLTEGHSEADTGSTECVAPVFCIFSAKVTDLDTAQGLNKAAGVRPEQGSHRVRDSHDFDFVFRCFSDLFDDLTDFVR